MHRLVLAALLAANPASSDPPPVSGRPAPQTEEEKKTLEEEISKELGAQSTQAAPPGPGSAPAAPGGPATGAQGSGTPGAGQGQTGGNPFARLLLLPDISGIGSGALAWNSLDVGTLSPRSDPFADAAHRVQPVFQELELGVQAVVDPYARADVFLSFSPDGAEVEEAYLTTLGLPAGLQIRAGTLLSPFGRQNQQHAHVWDFVDRPLALVRLLGADALRGAGLDASWLVPVPWFAEVHLAFQSVKPAFDPDSHNGGLVRLVQFFDVGQASTLGAGVSAAHIGENGVDASRDLLGADVFLKVRPPSTRSYLALQGEVLLRHLNGQEALGGPGGTAEPPGTEWGGYLHALYRDGPYFAYGVRYERAPAAGGGPENRLSALASWLPSEFERIRLQLSYDRLPGGSNGLEALLHLEFAIGAHGAHPF